MQHHRIGFTAPAKFRVFVDRHTLEVFRVPVQALPSQGDAPSRLGLNAGSEGRHVRHLRDIVSRNLLVVSDDQVEPWRIPDECLGATLDAVGATGLRTPYKFKPPFGLPLHGNLLDPKTATILFGGACNSRCSFCYTEALRQRPELDTEVVKAGLALIHGLGTVQVLTFTGGEATLRKDFLEIVEHASRMGFGQICLQTHGRQLGSHAAVADLERAGVTSVLLSLHGASAATHDAITRVEGSFTQALAALEVLGRSRLRVCVNTVVCRDNADELADVPAVLARAPGTRPRWRISYPVIEGAAHTHRATALIGFKAFNRAVEAALPAAAAAGLEVEAGTMPPCIAAQHGLALTYSVGQLAGAVHLSPFYRDNVPRGEEAVKLRACSVCAAQRECPGIQIEYLKRFPDQLESFRPVSASE